MERNFKTKAIVLKTRRFADIHKSVTLLCPENGIIEAVAHGAYKGKSRISSITDPFCESIFYLYYNPVRNSYKVNTCESVNLNNKIREKLNTFYTAAFFCEIILKTHASGAEYDFSYNLLHACLNELNKNNNNTQSVTIHFLYRFLINSGFVGDLTECTHCGKNIENENCYYSAFESSFLCRNCASSTTREIKAKDALFLRNSLTFNLEESVQKRLDSENRLKIRNILLEVIKNILDAPLNTLEYLDYDME